MCIFKILLLAVIASSSGGLLAASDSCTGNRVFKNGKCDCEEDYEWSKGKRRCVPKTIAVPGDGSQTYVCPLPPRQRGIDALDAGILYVFELVDRTKKALVEYRYHLTAVTAVASTAIFLRYLSRLGIETHSKISSGL